MRLIAFPLVGAATLAGVIALTAPAANQEGAATYVTSIPPGYRDWKLVSVAHEEGNFHSFSAVLGNDLAIQAYREGRSRSQTARSSPLCITGTCRRRKTTKFLAKTNLSCPAPRRTFSSWSRTQKSTPQRVVGVSLISRTANLPTRRS
jgi:hypothetical protein